MSYLKLDCGILDSTLWQARPQLQIFLTALLKAQPRKYDKGIAEIAHDSTNPTGYIAPPGWYGVVPASSHGLVRLALAGNDGEGYSFEDGMKALASLAEPEADSRSNAFDGRRMIRIDGGYLILNFMRYRDYDHNGAKRAREYRERKKAPNGHAERHDRTP